MSADNAGRVTLALLLAVLAPVWAGWECVNGNPPGIGAMSFLNADTGYVVGQGVFRTSDGGISFQNVTPGGWHDGYGCWVQFLAPDTGFAACQVVERRRLWKTTNDGNIWQAIYDARGSANAYDFVMPVCFLDAQLGYLVTGIDDSIRKTTNGGATWTATEVPGANRVSCIQFLDGQLGYALDHSELGGKLWKTTDGGSTWQLIWVENGPQSITEFQFVDSDVGYASGQRDAGNNGDYVGNVMKSSDGGTTWEELLATGAECDIEALSFSSRDTGFVSVEGGTSDNATARLFRTENGKDFVRVHLPLPARPYVAHPVFTLKGSPVAFVRCVSETQTESGYSGYLLRTGVSGVIRWDSGRR